MNSRYKTIHDLKIQNNTWTQDTKRYMNSIYKTIHELKIQTDTWTQDTKRYMNSRYKTIHELKIQTDTRVTRVTDCATSALQHPYLPLLKITIVWKLRQVFTRPKSVLSFTFFARKPILVRINISTFWLIDNK